MGSADDDAIVKDEPEVVAAVILLKFAVIARNWTTRDELSSI